MRLDERPGAVGADDQRRQLGARARVGLARRADLDQRHAVLRARPTLAPPARAGSPTRRGRRQQGPSAASRARRRARRAPSARPSITRTWAPTGAHTAGSVGPNSATVGQPTAAARWVGPESLPTTARASARSAAISGSGQSRARASSRTRPVVEKRLHRGGVGRTRQGDQGQPRLRGADAPAPRSRATPSSRSRRRAGGRSPPRRRSPARRATSRPSSGPPPPREARTKGSSAGKGPSGARVSRRWRLT